MWLALSPLWLTLSKMKFKDVLQINGKDYKLVSVQRGEETAVYKGENTFLRIGKKREIQKQLDLQVKLFNLGFKVPKIINQKGEGDVMFFEERSVGEEHFGELFAKSGTEKHFDSFLQVVEEFAHAQARVNVRESLKSFSQKIMLEQVALEFSEIKPKLFELFERVMINLENLPWTLSHGDFNPHNIYPNGVIDWENYLGAPFGYDLVSAVEHVSFFPEKNAEFVAEYSFTEEQKLVYFETLDRVCKKRGFLPVSKFKNEFRFLRLIWSLANMGAFPKLQSFRYKKMLEVLEKGLA